MKFKENLTDLRQREIDGKAVKCACGIKTYEKDGVCVICKLFDKPLSVPEQKENLRQAQGDNVIKSGRGGHNRKPHIKVICEICKKEFYVQPYRVAEGKRVRFCSKACLKETPRIIRKKKNVFTPELDNLITKVYQSNIGRQSMVKKLAIELNVPRWKITRRAAEIGAYIPLKKEPEWSEQELSIMGKYAHLNLSFIQTKLEHEGFHRSLTGIQLKRKRMRFISNLEGMSAFKAAEFFGVDRHWVTDKIRDGLIKAEMRDTLRTEKQGGDTYFIKEKELRRFIISNPELIDLRKVEKFYFIELLANGGVHG